MQKELLEINCLYVIPFLLFKMQKSLKLGLFLVGFQGTKHRSLKKFNFVSLAPFQLHNKF